MLTHRWYPVESSGGLVRHVCRKCGAELNIPDGVPPEDLAARLVTLSECKLPDGDKGEDKG